MKNEFNRMILCVLLSVGVIFTYNLFLNNTSSGNSTPEKATVTKVVTPIVTVTEVKKIPEGIIVTPLNKLLTMTRSVSSNYGVAIIMMTLLLRLLMSPLQFISLKSMKKMQEIQPQLTHIKEKFSKDPVKLRNETSKLFKSKSVNPLTGFLPILLQMPIFIALYTLLRESPDMVGAEFFGWLTDLSLHDPLFVLPILAGVAQLLMMKIGAKDTPEQKLNGKMKWVMPAVITAVMFKMPAALVLYSITSSVSSIFEKSVIQRFIA